MSRKRKGPAQSGQPRKRPIGPKSVPYQIENPTTETTATTAPVTQEGLKSELDGNRTGQPQTALSDDVRAPGGHSTEVPKGVKRPRGRPPKFGPIEERLDLATEAFLLQVISGESISQSGSTGRRFLAPAGLAVRTKAAELWISRRRPQLSAQAVAAQIQTDVRVETISDRELAQNIIRTLKLADVSEVIETKKLVAPTGEATGEAGHGDGALPPCKSKIEEPLEPKNPAHGHKVAARNSSGAYLRWHGTGGHGGKWAAYDSANVCVGMTPRWEKAVAILMNVKPATETIHPDPFELNEMGLEIADRRDQLAAQRSPRVLTRRRGR